MAYGSDNWALWIGLRDYVGRNNLADYKWIADNTSMQYANWAGTKPTNEQGKDCAMVIAFPLYGGIIGQLDDLYCSPNFGGICEIAPIDIEL